jgi:hypothetical protein
MMAFRAGTTAVVIWAASTIAACAMVPEDHHGRADASSPMTMLADFCVLDETGSNKIFRFKSVECTLPSEVRSWCPTGTFSGVHRLTVKLSSESDDRLGDDFVRLELTCLSFRFPDLKEISIDPRVSCVNLEQLDGNVRVINGCGVQNDGDFPQYDAFVKSELSSRFQGLAQHPNVNGELSHTFLDEHVLLRSGSEFPS